MIRLCSILFVTLTLCAQSLPSEEERAKRIARMEASLAGSPRDVGAWLDLALAYREAQRWDDAIRAATRAIEGHRKYAAAYYTRGRSHFDKRDLVPARADLSKAIELWESRGGLEKFLTVERPKPEHIDSYRVRGLAWAHEKSWRQAIADLEIAAKLDKNDAKLRYELAYLWDKAGDQGQAAEGFFQAGLLAADVRDRRQFDQAVEQLRRLGADDKVAQLRNKVESQQPKSDLPQ